MTFNSPSRHFIQQQPRHFAKKSLFGIYFSIPKPVALLAITIRHAGSVPNSTLLPIRILRVLLVAIGKDLFTRKIRQRLHKSEHYD